MQNKKKLVIYTTFPYWPRLETELEIADIHLNSGYEVTLLSCMGGLVTCPDNPNHYKLKCMSCTSRLKAGYKWIGVKRVKLKKLHYISKEQQKVIDSILQLPINNWEDFRSITIDNDDVGEAAFNELISHFRETRPPLNKKNREIVQKMLHSALITHFSIQNHLSSEKPDLFILFNGRISAYRPALRVAVSMGIDTKVLEVHFSYFDRYLLTDNTYSHDPKAVSNQVVKAYEQSNLSEKEKYEIASKWYTQREVGAGDEQFLFTQKQERGRIDDEIKSEKLLKIGFFITSEFEVVAESKSPFYENQNDAIARIADDLKNHSILLIVRAHPNLAGLNNSQIKDLEAICDLRPNVKYIPPESKVSTYELINYCDAVLTFGSTVGIEAVNKGKNSILMAPSIYKGFGGTIEPCSHNELVNLLIESAEYGNIPEKYIPSKQEMRRAATIYAFGLMECGTKLKYQNLNTFFKRSYIEKDGIQSYIRPNFLFRVYEFLENVYKYITIYMWR
jgi:hypothetical protein